MHVTKFTVNKRKIGKNYSFPSKNRGVPLFERVAFWQVGKWSFNTAKHSGQWYGIIWNRTWKDPINRKHTYSQQEYSQNPVCTLLQLRSLYQYPWKVLVASVDTCNQVYIRIGSHLVGTQILCTTVHTENQIVNFNELWPLEHSTQNSFLNNKVFKVSPFVSWTKILQTMAPILNQLSDNF